MVLKVRTMLAVLPVVFSFAGCGEENGSGAEVEKARSIHKEGEEGKSVVSHSSKASTAEKWAEWEASPEPYGGLEVLAKIRELSDGSADYLWLNGQQISDLSPMSGLTGLTYLHLVENRITDLTPLSGLKNLKMLILANNPIPDEQLDLLKKALPTCDIVFF